jgi:hypothetical protein
MVMLSFAFKNSMFFFLGNKFILWDMFWFFVVQGFFTSNPNEWMSIFSFTCTFRTCRAQKIIRIKHEQCTCYFLQFIILHGNAQMFDKSKIKVKVGVKHFLAHAFENFYIVIWYCMKLEDVLEVFPMLISYTFLD